MSTKNSQIVEIAFVTLAVSFSYYIGSILLNGIFFYIFDSFWRLSIVAAILFIGKYKPSVSNKQWLMFVVLVAVELLAYKVIVPSMSLIKILISTALAPVLEEFLFRGWMMEKIQGSWKEKIFLTSLFFSLYHLKNLNVLTLTALLSQVIYAGLIVGPIFAYARLKSNSLFVPLILHSGNNAFADTISAKILPFITKKQEYFD